MENNQERNQELIQKAIDIIQDTCLPDGYCTLALMDTDNRPIITTITPSKASGLEWITFCCGFGTRTERIAFRPDACVCFNSNTYHISLKGRMEVITDPAIKEEMWFLNSSLIAIPYLLIGKQLEAQSNHSKHHQKTSYSKNSNNWFF